MKQWSNRKHEEALRLRRQKNEERKYEYWVPAVSTAVNSNLSMTGTEATDFNGEPYYGYPKVERRRK